MPRRNRRDAYEPLDLTPKDLEQFRVRAPLNPVKTSEPDPAVARRARIRRELEAAERQRTARVNGGIDWTVCLVPGCGEQLVLWGMPIHFDPEYRDHNVGLPLCWNHLTVAGSQSQREQGNPMWTAANQRRDDYQRDKHTQRHEDQKRAYLARTDGHIYFVRLNGLVKVGWSRSVDERLRAYGPDVEVLVVYAGSRADETNLHRQLRPVLARGREWYEDGPIVADFVSRAILEHGQPEVFTNWTRPKQVVAGKRIRAKS